MGGGSGQQIVTWIPDRSASGALWLLRGPNGEEECDAGTPIRCGSKVRFTHVETRRNLHTHGIQSPLSRQQEITGIVSMNYKIFVVIIAGVTRICFV